MCLAIPGKIESIKDDSAVVDFDGIKKEINISLVSNAKINDYVNVHAGFAIQKLSQEDAWEVLKIYEQINPEHHKKNRHTL
ncbi:MAG: HypC/HybG/HupF family hydrogenase formation chaperone [Candidatus Terrybacteria bacterium]|nr:HypC/HybG/HupF family hydrogenase formation chaperone [Candidatus Terrybacteria bacterium]